MGGSFRALNIEFFPIPKNEEVVSHPVRAWSAGKISHTTELNDLHNPITRVKTHLNSMFLDLRTKQRYGDRLNHSIRDKSLIWLGGSFRALNIEFFPIPMNEEVVSHPVRAWSAGKISHTKGRSKRCHIDLNKLRVKLETVKDSTLVRLPPSEDTFKQHVLRSSYKTIQGIK
jgi:hypothetical protein